MPPRCRHALPRSTSNGTLRGLLRHPQSAHAQLMQLDVVWRNLREEELIFTKTILGGGTRVVRLAVWNLGARKRQLLVTAVLRVGSKHARPDEVLRVAAVVALSIAVQNACHAPNTCRFNVVTNLPCVGLRIQTVHRAVVERSVLCGHRNLTGFVRALSVRHHVVPVAAVCPILAVGTVAAGWSIDEHALAHATPVVAKVVVDRLVG
eukprot:269509-Prymnesium_polylepis.1